MSQRSPVKLGQWFATAICGNDILSSALYVSGIAIIFSGIYAPLVLVIIAVILYFYKSVYTEVVEALPINGGAYNCLLNSTSKIIAAIAGVATILSYVATAVISAKVSIDYLHVLLPVPIIAGTIVLLFFFAVLVVLGLKDSARFAFFIFLLHICTLFLFIFLGGLYLFSHHTFFVENFVNSAKLFSHGNIFEALFFGFSASLLGVSGFESSANFVEEQKPGVFRKTLRNMLIGVAFFNPLIALIVLGASPLASIASAKDFLLASEALIVGGSLFRLLLVVDAFLVLAGAVLTSFIGVSGLMYRMASDACLPEFLTYQNKSGSFPRIIATFFILCTSILLVTKGNLLSLAGVYTISFLSVMSLFAFGNLILRETRAELKRTYSAPFVFVVLAFMATGLGIVGNIRIDYNNFTYFMEYFLPALLLVITIVFEDQFMLLLLRFSKHIPFMHSYIERHFHDITSGTIVAFVNHVDKLYSILSYVHRNETARDIILVHCRNHDNTDDLERYAQIEEALPILQKAGAFPHFMVQLIYRDITFGGEAIDMVSKELGVRKNRILIGSIHHFHKFNYDDLGGVRIIF